MQQEKYDDAIQVLSRAVALDPNDAKTRNYLGISSSRKGLAEAAEQECRKAIELDDSYGDAHISATFNNIIISLTNKSGQVISWSSAGKMGFKGSKKLNMFPNL